MVGKGMEKRGICTFYIARHGETDWNAGKIVLGQNPKPKLTRTGVKQAEQIKKKLKKIKFDAVFTSDLSRTVQTAQIIIGSRKLKIQKMKELRERSYGEYDGRPADEYEKETAKKFKQREKLLGIKRMKFKIGEGIETDYQVFNRFSKKLKQLGKKHAGQNILIVTHGGCIRNFLVGNNLAKHHQLPKDKLLFGDYLKVRFDGFKFRVK